MISWSGGRSLICRKADWEGRSVETCCGCACAGRSRGGINHAHISGRRTPRKHCLSSHPPFHLPVNPSSCLSCILAVILPPPCGKGRNAAPGRDFRNPVGPAILRRRSRRSVPGDYSPRSRGTLLACHADRKIFLKLSIQFHIRMPTRQGRPPRYKIRANPARGRDPRRDSERGDRARAIP